MPALQDRHHGPRKRPSQNTTTGVRLADHGQIARIERGLRADLDTAVSLEMKAVLA